jgi:hypothetical protein
MWPVVWKRFRTPALDDIFLNVRQATSQRNVAFLSPSRRILEEYFKTGDDGLLLNPYLSTINISIIATELMEL